MATNFFLSIINQSIMGTGVILAVLLARYFLKKKEQATCFALWSLVFLRLSLPFTFEIPDFQDTEGKTISTVQTFFLPRVENPGGTNSSFPPTELPENPPLTENKIEILEPETKEIEYFQVVLVVWVLGVGMMLGFFLYSSLKLQKKLRYASKIEDNLYALDHIQTAFVWGLLKPKIYLPSAMTEEEKSYILPHEQYHIQRFDHISRLFAYFCLSFHWFNPFVWLAYVLAGKDMELSVDEKMIGDFGENKLDFRQKYAQTLLHYATNQKLASPLAFGQGSVKDRICNIMKTKQNNKFVTGFVTVFALVTLVACSAENTEDSSTNNGSSGNISQNTTENTTNISNSTEDFYEYDIEALQMKWQVELQSGNFIGFYEEYFSLFGNQELVQQTEDWESLILEEFGIESRVFTQTFSGKEYVQVFLDEESLWLDLNGEEIPRQKEIDTPNVLDESVDFMVYNQEIQDRKQEVRQAISQKIMASCEEKQIDLGQINFYYADSAGMTYSEYGESYPVNASITDMTVELAMSGDYFITGLTKLSKEERKYHLVEEFIAKTELGETAELRTVWLSQGDGFVDESAPYTSKTHDIFSITDIYFENGLYEVHDWFGPTDVVNVKYFSHLIQEHNEASHVVHESGMETFSPASNFLFLAHDPRGKSSDFIWTYYQFLFMEQIQDTAEVQ